ncbi:hypothetical protein BG000_003009 [Podila horticola]|nr:hypothetical protein BG000_003009 [Podila horticola]
MVKSIHARDQTQEAHLSIDKVPNVLSNTHATLASHPSSQNKPREESDEDSDVSIYDDDDDDDEFDSEMDDSESYYDSDSASEQEERQGSHGSQGRPSAVMRSDLEPIHSSRCQSNQLQQNNSESPDVNTGRDSNQLAVSDLPKIKAVHQDIARATMTRTETFSTHTEASSIAKVSEPKDPSSIPNPPNYTPSSQAKARMVLYVEEEDEDEEDDDEDYSVSEGYDDAEEEEEEEQEEGIEIQKEIDEEEEEEDMDDEDSEDEDEYSCSEDDEEEEDEDDDESLDDYHYGARQDPRSRSKGHYSSRPNYGHFRPARLDENLLQKRAITKQVVRRSSLTALFGEAQFQPDQTVRSATVTPGATFGQQPRRPALSGVWPEPSVHSLDNDVKTSALLAGRTGSALGAPELLKRETSESNRPRRTDSGVEVKISPSLRFNSPASSEASDQRRSSPGPVEQVSVHSSSSSSRQSTPPQQEAAVRRLRIKSESDIPESSVAAHSLSEDPTVGTCPVRPLLRSSISANTFPRVASKRAGVKHVRWHHSLFPTERVLRVKPSLPSLSTVAAESAEATLSQLPPVPVMARDNVKDFHQSIRSLRTLSRIEITRMSYKQQGRQELTSPVPISKSVNDSIPWWNPSRWLKGPVSVDKRHWKPDSSRESCAYCYAPFHRISNPRHHCRKCGDIFCGQCASAEILMDAKNCVYVQQSQLARWSRRVDIQRHSLWIDTLPQLHPVRTAAESGLVGCENKGSVGHAGGHAANGLGGVSMGHRSSSGSGSGGRRGSWQVNPAAMKKSRVSIFGLFNGPGANGSPQSPYAGSGSDSRRGSMDISANEHHGAFLQPHNSVGVAFATGRRASSSSLMRNNTVSGSGSLMMTDALGPIAMSRRMSSGGVGEVCLARICVGCERELLKPTKRCTSIAKYYTIGARPGYRSGHPSGFGHQGYGHPHHPHHQHPQHPQQQPQVDVEDHPGNNYDQHGNGVRRHSPLRQTYVLSEEQSQDGHGYGPCRGQAQGGPWSRDEAVGPHGETRYCQGLSFQEQQLQYVQTCFSRELV